MKKTKISKAASLLLSLMLVLTLIPSAGAEMAFAAEGETETSTAAESVSICNENGGTLSSPKALSSENSTWKVSGKGKATFSNAYGKSTLTLENYNYYPISASGGDITLVLSGENTITGAQEMPEGGYNFSTITGLTAYQTGVLTIKGDTEEGEDSLTIDLTGNEKSTGEIYGIFAKKIVIDGNVSVTVNVKGAKAKRYALYAKEGIEIKNGATLTISFDEKCSTDNNEYAIYNDTSGDIVIDKATVDVNIAKDGKWHNSIYNKNGGVKIKNGSKVTLDGCSGEESPASSDLKSVAITIGKLGTPSKEHYIEISGSKTEVNIENYGFAIIETITGEDEDTTLPDYGTVVKGGAELNISNCMYGIRSKQGELIEDSKLTANTYATAISYESGSKKSLEVEGNSSVELKSDAAYALDVNALACASFDLSTGGCVTLKAKERKTDVLLGYFQLGNNTIVDNEKNYAINKSSASKWHLYTNGNQPETWVTDFDDYYSIKFVPNKILTAIRVSPVEGLSEGDTPTLAVPTKAKGTDIMEFKATGTYGSTDTADITDSVDWSVTTTAEGTDVPDGVSIDNTGKLTVTPEAEAGNVYIKAKSGDVSSEAFTLTLAKAAAELKELTITGPDTVAIPVAAAESDNTGNYSCEGTDQYGKTITVTGAVWSVVGEPTGVSISSETGVLTVKKGAAATDYLEIKVAVGSVSKEKTIRLTKEASAVTKVKITGSAPTLEVPEVTEISGTASTPVTNTYTYEAKVYDQYDAVMSGESVVWSVSGDDGVTIDASNGNLTVKNTATAASVTVTATCGGKSASETVSVTRAEEKAKFVQILKGETPVTTDNIIIPTTDTPNTVAYGFKVYNQYGNEMTGQTAVWSATGTNEKVTFSGSTLTVAKDAVVGTVTVKAKVGDAEGAEGTVTVSVNNKETVTITGITPVDGTYNGSSQNGYTGTASYSPAWSGTLTTTYYLADGTTKTTTDNSGAAGEGQAPKNAGTYKVTLAIPDSDANNTGSLTVEFTIAPKTLTKADLEYTGTAITKVYNGTTDCEVTSVAVKSDVLASGDTLTVNGTAVYNSENVYEANNVTFTPDAITSGNYRLAATETLEIDATITSKTVTPTVTVSGSYTFNGTAQQPTVTVTAEGETLTDDDYTVGYDNNINAGTAAKVKVTAESGRNYTWEGAKEQTFTIGKAAAQSLTDIEKKVKFSNTAQQELDLSNLMPDNAGTLSYTLETVTDSDGILADKAVGSTDGKLTFKLNDSLTEGKEATVQVKITSTNYDDSTVTVKIKTIAKDVPTLTVENINVVYTGSAVADTAISGTASFDGTTVNGTWKFESGTAVTNVSDSGSKTVVFTPEDTTNYDETTTTITVTIAKATPTVTPKFDKVTESGKKLSDANLTATSTPEGTIAWNDDATTEVEANKAYGWTFTPTDNANYNTVTGTLVVWTKSSGGGAIGGGGFIIPTTQKPEVTIDNTQGKLELSADGTTANITANEGYEIEKVTVNGVDKGAVNKLTGLKTGDKVVVSFKSTAPAADDSAALETIKEKVAKLQFMARSSKTSKKNVKLTLKFDSKTSAEINEFKSLGYTVKYKFYRSTKKSKGYKAVLTKTSKTYTNTKGVKGTKYYYKARVQVFDKDGKLVAQTELKQCRYASRTWTK